MPDTPIQIELRSKFEGDDYEWALMCAHVLLNRVHGRVTRRALEKLWAVADTAESMAKARFEDIRDAIRECGLYNRNAGLLKALSEAFVAGKRRWDLPGYGPYANESTRIFIDGEVFIPGDRVLRAYLIREGRIPPQSL